MSDKKPAEKKSIWDKQASVPMIIFCAILIIACFCCFCYAYLQFKHRQNFAADEIWTDSSLSYDQKIRLQRQVEDNLNADRIRESE